MLSSRTRDLIFIVIDADVIFLSSFQTLTHGHDSLCRDTHKLEEGILKVFIIYLHTSSTYVIHLFLFWEQTLNSTYFSSRQWI